MDYMKVYEQWCTDPYFDDETKKELLAIKDDKAEIEDRFYRQLEFGTGGLRGVIGAGTRKLHYFPERTEQGRCDRIRFPYHVQRIRR